MQEVALPKKTNTQKRIYAMQRTDVQFKQCHAIKESGYSCRCKSMAGEAFCYSHLMQGYGLFTLAAANDYRTNNSR